MSPLRSLIDDRLPHDTHFMARIRGRHDGTEERLGLSLGGGSDNAASARAEGSEAAREIEMQAAIDQINGMFGVAPIRKVGATKAYKYAPSVAFDNTADVNAAKANAPLREAAYSASGKDIMDYYRSETDEQRSRSADIIAVDMARRGLSAGSAKTDVDEDLTDQYNDMIQDFQTQTDGAVTGMKTADEQARLDLISRIRQGMDVNSAIAGANTALSNNINAAASAAKTVPIEGLFRDLDELYGQRKAYDAYQTAYDQVSGVPTPGGGKVSLGYES